jgi:putative transposase
MPALLTIARGVAELGICCPKHSAGQRNRTRAPDGYAWPASGATALPGVRSGYRRKLHRGRGSGLALSHSLTTGSHDSTLRPEFPGALYHVTTRDNDRANIYLGDEDRQAFLDVLGEVCRRMQWVCYAYCLMTNHFHLVVETQAGHLSKGMRQVNGIYTQRFNRCHARVDHVLQGRYKAILVERDIYFLALARYMVLNPMRAHMVKSPVDWLWSSYRATVGQASAPDWLATHWVLHQFGRTAEPARARYAQFVHDGQTQPSIWDSLQRQMYLGDAQFVTRMQAYIKDTGDLDDIPKVQRQPPHASLDDFVRVYDDQHAAMAAAYLSGTYTM